MEPPIIDLAFGRSRTFLSRDRLDLVHHQDGPLHDLTVIVPGAAATGQSLLGSPLSVFPPGVAVGLNFALPVKKGTRVPLRISGATDAGDLFIYDTAVTAAL